MNNGDLPAMPLTGDAYIDFEGCGVIQGDWTIITEPAGVR